MTWITWGVAATWIGRGAALALGALFLGGYLARYVPPQSLWWLQLLALGLPYLAIPVGAVGIGAIVSGRWGLAALYVPLLVLLTVRFFPPWPAADRLAKGEALTIMTYNAGTSGTGHTGASFRALLNEERPDVLALQEVGIRFMERPDLFAVQAGFGGVLSEGAYDPGVLASTADEIRQPVFARTGRADIVRFEAILEGREGIRVVRAEVERGGRRFVVYNLHLHSFDSLRPWKAPQGLKASPKGWLRRWRDALQAYREDFVRRADEARRLRERIEAETLPFIVCGDFNSTRHQWAYGHLASGLSEALVAGGAWRRMTFPARRPLVGIDHILTSPEWRVLSAHVSQDAHSDHRPVIALLLLED